MKDRVTVSNARFTTRTWLPIGPSAVRLQSDPCVPVDDPCNIKHSSEWTLKAGSSHPCIGPDLIGISSNCNWRLRHVRYVAPEYCPAEAAWRFLAELTPAQAQRRTCGHVDPSSSAIIEYLFREATA
jgi:hypothetical protein